jgi:hypothetical protein
MEITSVGGYGSGANLAQGGTANTTSAPPSSGNIAGQVATDTATQSAAGESNRLGIVGSALGNSVLGAFHRKKAAQPTPTPVPASANSAAPGTQAAGAILMQMTQQKTNFSKETIPTSIFEVPRGFKQVASPMEAMLSK